MTSTFSSNLNLQLQGLGDNSNSWGSVLNSSVFTNIDQACGGSFSVSVAGSSDYTLSQANAQNFEHITTGALTGNINYIFPLINSAAPGRYISFFNNTSGNFTITVKQSGGTGIVVPQGLTRMLKLSANNTTTADVLNNLSSLNLGIPSSAFGTLGFYNGSNANIAALKAGNMGSSVTWTLPTGDGTNGQTLITNGTGILSWTANTPTNNSVTNAMLAQMAPLTIKGNNGTSTANAADNSLSSYFDAALGTAQGSITYRGTSTWGVLTPGSSGQILQTGGAAANPSWTTAPAFTKSYNSGAQTYSSGGTLTLAHGLGATPKMVSCYMTCTSNDQGYTTGQVIHVPAGFIDLNNGNGGMGVIVDATNISVKFGGGTGGTGIGVTNFSTGNGARLAFANWTITFEAYV